MKLIVYILSFFVATPVVAQWYKPTKNDVAIVPMAFVSGYLNGVEETIKFHYNSFKRVHPNANDQYWNPAISWTNKNDHWYTRVMPLTSDGYHLTRGVSRILMVGQIAISINDKADWKVFVRKFIISMVANRAGQYLSYNIIYKQ